MIEPRPYRRMLIGCAYLAAYVAFDYVSFVKPYHGLGITPWNPSPGLSLALVYLGGLFYAPFVLAAPAIADVFVRASSIGPGIELVTSVTSGGTYLAAGLALQRLLPFDPRLRTVRDVLTLIGIAACAAATASIFYSSSLLAFEVIDRSEAGAVAWRSFVGDLIGTLVVAPIVLLASTLRPWPWPGAQSVLQLAAIVGALAIVFGYREATAFQLFYLLFLPLLWVALTYGTLGSAVALVVIQIGLILGAEIRFGAEPGLTALQVLMITLAITGLIVGAIVSEREAGAARLRDQQAALNRALRIRSAGEIAAAIAHEINQPLTAMSTYSGIASRAMGEGNSDLAAEAVAKVRTECERANTVIRSIRELLRQGTLSTTPVDMRTTLAEIGTLLADDLAAKGARLVVTVPADFPTIHADAIQLQQAVHNLVINSADAMASVGRSGLVSVNVTLVDQQSFLIEIHDDGPGFPPGIDTREPTPFLSTKPDGSGLGLLVVRSIAEAHGGSLAIKSSPRGATVSLRLPILREANGGDGLYY